MTKSNVIDLEGRESSIDPLTELLRTGTRQMLQQAIEAELQELLSTHADRRLEDPCVERFNRTVRHEWLNQHLFESIEHAQHTATEWLWQY